jgi:hypothetical protein
LLVLPEWTNAEFKDWKWINMNEWWDQKILINIWRTECANSTLNTDSKKDVEDWVEEDSWSFFEKIFKKK